MADENSLSESDPSPAASWIVARPPEILNRLPLPMKWEFTRRHPYYQRYWEVVARHARQPSSDLSVRDQAEAARLLLQIIGVMDVPHPPGTPFAELDGNDLARVWVSGAVAPAMFRTLVGVLMTGLSPKLCVEVGRLLIAFGSLVDGTSEEKQYLGLLALQKLVRLAPDLNAFPDVPFVSVNTNAPLRAIEDAVRELVGRFKAQRNVTETRWRDDALPDYLEAWDRREGWVIDRYDCGREQTLAEIARTLEVPLRTVQNRYRSAFQLLVGHEYTPELWETLVGSFKWTLLTDGVTLTHVSTRRPRRTRQRRPVPEATLSGRDTDGERTGFVVEPAAQSDVDLESLWADIRDLIVRDWTNTEIRTELDLIDDRFEEVLNHMRDRTAESV